MLVFKTSAINRSAIPPAGLPLYEEVMIPGTERKGKYKVFPGAVSPYIAVGNHLFTNALS